MDSEDGKTEGSFLRRHPVHGVESRIGQPTIVFLTVCTRNRSPWLADPSVHDQLRSSWESAQAWLVGRYVIMPDHLHCFVAPGQLELPLEKWVRYWKSLFSKAHGVRAHDWQADHWDRRLRCGESYEEKWNYVLNNPVRHGLATIAEDWPYQGELHRLAWS